MCRDAINRVSTTRDFNKQFKITNRSMTQLIYPPYQYQVGGSLPTNSPTYVERQADIDLHTALRKGEFCYVLNSRQMGKSSLKVRTIKRLQSENFACIDIDITSIGTADITAEQWYAGIINSIINNLEIYDDFDLNQWWQKEALLSPVNRLSKFINNILLPSVSQDIVIFVDEIDSVLSLKFEIDDFFALIRECYNNRATKPDYGRLSFALFGVAAPSDLIQDKRRTPFNIGRPIQLTGFKLQEAQPLAQGLAAKTSNPMLLMSEILKWTGGQPFLTQKLCQMILDIEDKIPEQSVRDWINQLVQTRVISNWESQDEPEHLKTIRDRILRGGGQRTSRLLGLYQQVLQQEVPDDNSLEQTQLRFSGLLVRHDGKLKVYNLIYAAIFNDIWLEKALADLRPYAQALKAWVTSNYQDESRLLRGQALQDALAWAAGKSLSNQDYDFLSASQKLDKREIEIALAVKEEEGQILAQANEILNKAQKKAQRRIRIGATILALSIVGAIIAGIFAGNAIKQVSEAQEGTKIEQAANIALNQFEKQHQEIDALLVAMDAGQTLKEMVKDGRPLEKYPAASPILALQTIVDNIRERNQLNHQQKVNSAAFSPDGQRIVTISGNDTVKVWDANGKLVADLKAHQGYVNSVAFSADGQRIVTTSFDNTAKVWNVNGKLVADLKTHQGYVTSVAFNADGQRIVTASSNGTVEVWDQNGKLVTDFKVYQDKVTSAAFNSGKQHIATASSDNTGEVSDADAKFLTDLIEGRRKQVTNVAFSPEAGSIVTAFSNGTVKVWDVNGKLVTDLKGHQGVVTKAAFSPDGRRIITVSDNTVKVWDVNGKLVTDLKGHQGVVTKAAFSPNGCRIITVSNNTVKVWDVNGKLVADLKGHQDVVTSAVFSPDRQHIVTASDDNTAKVWDVNGKLVADLKGHQDEVTSAAFSSDGQRIVTTSSDNTAKVWYIKGKLLVDLKESEDVVKSAAWKSILSSSYDSTAKVWHLNGVNGKSVAHNDVLSKETSEGTLVSTITTFSPDRQFGVTISSDGTTKVLDVNGKLVADLKAHQKKVTRAAFSPNGQRIVTASNDGTAKVWDVNGRLVADLKAHQKEVYSAVFSPDGQHIVTASNDGTAKVWDVNGKLVADLKAHQKEGYSAAFSSDGQDIITASNDGTTKVWDLNGKLVTDLKGHQRQVTSAAFSPNRQRIVTASIDRTAKVWNVNGELVADLKAHQKEVTSAEFSPDGQRIVTTSSDGTTKVWDANGHLIADLKAYQGKFPNAVFSPDGQRIITTSYGRTTKVWRVGGLDELLTRGCDWLQDYFVSHPEARENLRVCKAKA